MVEEIEVVTPEHLLEIVNSWCDTGQMPAGELPANGYLAHEDNGDWTVVETEDNECYTESFMHRCIAELYLTDWDAIGDSGEFYLCDEILTVVASTSFEDAIIGRILANHHITQHPETFVQQHDLDGMVAEVRICLDILERQSLLEADSNLAYHLTPQAVSE